MAAKQYEVVGNHPVLHHVPGSRFRAELDEWMESVLIEAGHLRVVNQPDLKEKNDEE